MYSPHKITKEKEQDKELQSDSDSSSKSSSSITTCQNLNAPTAEPHVAVPSSSRNSNVIERSVNLSKFKNCPYLDGKFFIVSLIII